MPGLFWISVVQKLSNSVALLNHIVVMKYGSNELVAGRKYSITTKVPEMTPPTSDGHFLCSIIYRTVACENKKEINKGDSLLLD